MPPFAEIRHYFEGAWRLAQGDVGGMAHFDVSADGFWRSFWAIVVVAPGYAVIVADQYVRSGDLVAFWPTFTAETLTYFFGWAAFPILAIWLTRMFDLSERYVPLIVSLNWSSMVQIGALLVAVALGAVLSPALVAFILAILTGALLFYHGFVIKTALGCTVGTAAIFLAADLVAVMIINGLVFSIVVG